MRLIEKIFGRKEESPSEIKFGDLPGWLDQISGKMNETVGRRASSVYSEIEDALSEIKRSAKRLEEAEPEGRFHLKMVKIATSNRDNMVKQVRLLIENITIPKTADVRAIVAFHEKAMQSLTVCLENMMKSYQYAKLVFLDESKQLIADVNALGRLLNYLIEPVDENKKAIDAVENAARTLQAIKDTHAAIDSENTSIKEKEEKAALLSEEIEEKQNALIQLKSSERWKQYLDYRDELADLENKAQRTESDINGLVLPLSKALTRLKQLSESGRYTLAPDIREGLYLCMSDPKSASPEFFVELYKIVESDVLGLERLDKMLEQIRLVEASFGTYKKQYQDIMLAVERKKDEISRLDVVAEEKNLSDYISAMQDKLASLEKELEVSKKHLATLEESVELKKQRLQQNVSVIDGRVRILF